jgi:hypothetical protein
MKRFAVLTILLLTLTACAAVNVPPVDYDEPSVEITELETMTESPATTETTAPTRPAATKATKASASGDEDQTETVTEPLVIPDWAETYAALIRQKNADSEHLDAAYAMIRLDADEIPELVLLDDLTAELYYYDNKNAVLLLEDSYKSAAVSGQNFCFQPETGRVASYFSTMGGGSGFNLFFYDSLDPRQSVRYCFNNYETEDGDMPYNPIWDRAEEFDVLLDEDLCVSLGRSWTHIGTGFEDIHKLAAVTGKKLTMEWNAILGGTHDPDELETEETDEQD